MDISTLTSFIVVLTCCVHFSKQHGGGFEVNLEQDPENTLRRSEFIRDKDHIREHMKDVDLNPDDISPEELDFHFFKVHDVNEDNNLDGLELLQALRHAVEEQIAKAYKEGQAQGPEMKSKPFLDNVYQHLEGIVDKILKDDDGDNNGYINYSEFVHSRRASEMLKQINQAGK